MELSKELVHRQSGHGGALGGHGEARHLRLRAEHLRWRLVNLEWRVRHLPGSIMPADLGTKVLPVQRFDELKQLMNMHCEKEPEKEAAQLVDSKVMKPVVLMTMIQRARGQETTEEDMAGVSMC